MNLINIIAQVGKEKGIDQEILKDVVKSAVASASKKSLHLLDYDVETDFNEDTGAIELFVLKSVVKNPKNEKTEISLEEALKIDPDAHLDKPVKIFQQAQDLGRISAQLAKQVIIQKVREAERESVFNDFKEKKGEIINIIVSRFEKGDIIVDIDGKTEGILPKHEQSMREKFKRGDMLKGFIVDVTKKSKNPPVVLSRTHPGLLIKLFELEVPEVGEDIVEIINAVREANGRSKIAVHSKDKNVDAVGACVGVRGVRVQAVVQELRGEKIDIVEWSENPVEYVTNALKPAKIFKVNLNSEEHSMEVIVPKDQLSLAIGKSGQNVRLAARLTGWKIDIKNEEDLKKQAEMELNQNGLVDEPVAEEESIKDNQE